MIFFKKKKIFFASAFSAMIQTDECVSQRARERERGILKIEPKSRYESLMQIRNVIKFGMPEPRNRYKANHFHSPIISQIRNTGLVNSSMTDISFQWSHHSSFLFSSMDEKILLGPNPKSWECQHCNHYYFESSLELSMVLSTCECMSTEKAGEEKFLSKVASILPNFW